LREHPLHKAAMTTIRTFSSMCKAIAISIANGISHIYCLPG
jgi:hypothetical protein